MARRGFLLAATLVVASAGCAEGRSAGVGATGAAADGRLTARPHTGGAVRRGARGRFRLAHRAELYVPPTYRRDRPSPVVLTLHGANGRPGTGFGQLLPLADEAGLILLAPKSARGTWDIAYGGFGADVAAIDDLLHDVFGRYAVDPSRVYISGFSDGASYALSLGLTNGDLFRAIVAFSPGFVQPGDLHGDPRVFISHGTRDTTLPIAKTSRRIVPTLRKRGYRVTYREFGGPHTVPPPMARAAVAWLARGG